MAPPDLELVEISLLSGRSARPSISFTPGAPAPTVSVGSAAQWSVEAEGVQPIHAFLAFDGQAVHVAAAVPGIPVLLAGAAVGKDWMIAPVPCELRFGGACLILRRVPRPGVPAQEERTMHDGGALLLAAQQRASLTPSPVTQPLGRAMPNVPSVRPAAGAPPDTARTAPPAMPGAPPPGAPDMGSTVPLADPHGFHEAVLAATAGVRPPSDSAPTQVRAPVASASPAAGAPQPPPLDWEKTVVAPHPPGFVVAMPPHPEPPMPHAPPPPTAPAPLPPASPAATAPSPAAEAIARVRAQMLASWREASPVKRATMLLMPFALVGALFILHDEPPAPPAKAPHPAASTSAAAVRAVDASGAALTTAPSSAADAGVKLAQAADVVGAGNTDGPPKVAALPAGKRTPEREALDTAAAGAFEDAAKRYDALVAAHPDDPSYKEAARILRARAAN